MILNANALHLPVASNTVQCCVTSPPYYGLRDYGTASWEGGNPGCDHKQKTARNDGGRENTNGFHGSSKENSDKGDMNYRDECPICGAIRIDKQLGLEPTPDAYVANLVSVFREVWRVLRDDGTLWLNLGDSYNGNNANTSGASGYNDGRTNRDKRYSTGGIEGLKPKDLIGIPWMVAFALRADGWYLRMDCIWSKPNPMPESVTDRPTKSHEYLFLLTKNAKYYYDNEAIKEESDGESGWARERRNGKNTWEYNMTEERIKVTGQDKVGVPTENGQRNKRSVWTINTQPTSYAHFATFPEKLVEPCILAGSSEKGCCPVCRAPWERTVEKDRKNRTELDKDDPRYRPNQYSGTYENINGKGDAGYTFVTTTGWQPSCSCNAGDPVPCLILDPFAGSGTTGRVAIRHNRKFVGTELNFKYIDEISHRRLTVQPLMVSA